jgi:hypothetical protein
MLLPVGNSPEDLSVRHWRYRFQTFGSGPFDVLKSHIVRNFLEVCTQKDGRMFPDL